MLATSRTDETRTVAITGATGFIGRQLTRTLRGRGWEVRALVRDESKAGFLAAPGVELVQGSLEDDAALGLLVSGVDAVAHCAGAVRGATQAQFDRTNVEGVRRLVGAACGQPRPPRFLALSSLAAREPRLSAYAASKRGGEQILAETAGAMPWAALRPPAVYGPGDRELLPLFRLMARGLLPQIAPDNARFSVIFVGDLADAACRWLESKTFPQGIFELHDGHTGGYSWADVIRIVEGLSGRPVRRLKIPPAVLRVPAALNWTAGWLLPYAPMLTPGKLRELTHEDWVCDNDRIRAVLSWSPQVDLEQGLRLTPGWRPERD